MLTLEQGELLIRFARNVITAYFEGKEPDVEPLRNEFYEKRGSFVTLSKDGGLRGCIGYTEPIYPLYRSVASAAINAAFNDIRFPPLGRGELDCTVISVSVLSLPELVKVEEPQDYANRIKIGRDGLIVKSMFGNGLLLPQVAVEQGWSAAEFMSGTCVKAGLPPSAWLEMDDLQLYRFGAEVFCEKTPKGEVVREV